MNCGGAENSGKYVLALSMWQGLEHWLGKTRKVEASSTPSLLFNILRWTIASIHEKLKRKELK